MNVVSTVDVSGTGYVGGIAGVNYGHIAFNLFNGTVVAVPLNNNAYYNYSTEVGGLVGANNAGIWSSQSAGSIFDIIIIIFIIITSLAELPDPIIAE